MQVHLNGGGIPAIFYDLGALEALGDIETERRKSELAVAAVAAAGGDGGSGAAAAGAAAAAAGAGAGTSSRSGPAVFPRLTAQSAGAVAVCAYATGVSAASIAREVQRWHRTPGGFRPGNVSAVFRAILDKLLVPDCHEVLASHNVAFLATAPGWLPLTGSTVVLGPFESKEAVIQAVLASCHIPLLSDFGYSSTPLG